MGRKTSKVAVHCATSIFLGKVVVVFDSFATMKKKDLQSDCIDLS